MADPSRSTLPGRPRVGSFRGGDAPEADTEPLPSSVRRHSHHIRSFSTAAGLAGSAPAPATVGSLRDLLEALRFDLDDSVNIGARAAMDRQGEYEHKVHEEKDDYDELDHADFGEGNRVRSPQWQWQKDASGGRRVKDGEEEEDSDEFSSEDGEDHEDDIHFDKDQGHHSSFDSSSASIVSYQDAGYMNEEEYLFDKYGGIGGTAEERSILADSLMKTLNAGPMADDLFYEEMAMCFLRCRERQRIKKEREMRRRERKRVSHNSDLESNVRGASAGISSGRRRRARRERKRATMKMEEQGQNHHQHDNNGVQQKQRYASVSSGGEETSKVDASSVGLSGRMSKINLREGNGRSTTGATSGFAPVDSEELNDEDHDDISIGLSHVTEEIRNVNVESDYEDVLKSRRRGAVHYNESNMESGGGHIGDTSEVNYDNAMPDDYSAPSSTSPLHSSVDINNDHDEGVIDDDSFMEVPKSKINAPSSETLSDIDNMRGEHNLHSSMFTNVDGRPYSWRTDDVNIDEIEYDEVEFTNSNNFYSKRSSDDFLTPIDEFESTQSRRSSLPSNEDKQDEGMGPAVPTTPRSSQESFGIHQRNNIHSNNEQPIFRVDLKKNNKKGIHTKKGGKYPPPPPPPPPPRGQHPDQSINNDQGSPMDVDIDLEGLTLEEKIAQGARRCAEDSALKNDHESLRKEFSIGSAGDPNKNTYERKGVKLKHPRSVHQPKPPEVPQKQEKSFFEFDDGTTMTEDPILDSEDEHGNAKRQRVAMLRDEGRSFYINGAYRESILRYTDAITVHTDNFQLIQNNSKDDILAALYGNRAAALMMTGSYSGAAADCNRALQCMATDSTSHSLESGPAFRSKILCRMARAHLKGGEVWEADKAFQLASEAASQALLMLNRSGAKSDEIRQGEKILSQCQTDATLGLSDVKRYRDALDGAFKVSSDSTNKGANVSTDRRNSVQLLMFINAALSVSPGSMELHERKVNTLASLKRWAELGNECERLAAEMVKIDGIFLGDLAPLNPFPDVRHAASLKPDFFERNPDDVLDPPSFRILSPKAVCDAVLRLPNGILPLYLRSLRLEERYTEAARAGATIETHISNSKHKGNRGHVPLTILSNERDKLRRTMSWKEKGDTLFRAGDYERAALKYAACLGIDGDTTDYNSNATEHDDAGGRLHAVLHCNRAACLMALKKYREAVKECTTSLRIHTHYMKAMLRRGRCFARLRQFQEAVSEYERYIQLVDEARRSPQSFLNTNAACTFDRPIEITPEEYTKAKHELADVKKSMKQATATAQTQKEKQSENQQWYDMNFRKAAASNAAQRRKQEAPGQNNNTTAYTRKQQWDSSDTNTRRWDQFGGASPKKQAQKKTAKDAPGGVGGGPTAGPSANRNKQQQQQQQQQQQPTSSNKDLQCHYQVLEINMTASSAEIKKAYHKMALKYHPDKNSEEGAADIFRRVKLAYEVLGNDVTRIAYDAERRRVRR